MIRSSIGQPIVPPIGRPLSGGGLPWEGGGGAAPWPPLETYAPHLLLDERGLTTDTGYSAWANQGSAGGNVVQATGANQPGTGRTINGRAAPDFDGTNDSMLSSLAPSAYMTTSEFEGILVIQADALPATVAANWYTGPAIIAVSTSSTFGVALTRDGLRLGTGNTPYAPTTIVPVYADSLPHVIQFRYVSGSMYVSVDGGPERVTTIAAPVSLLGGLRVGANYNASTFANGLVATVFLRKTALTSGERSAARNYLSGKYAVPVPSRRRDFLWIGDSITAGSPVGSAQWRARVQSVAGDFYRAAGGSYGSANVAFPQDISISGGGATTVTTLTSLTTNSVGTLRYADVVPILLGTNDIAVDGVTNATLATRYLALIADIDSRLPNSLIVAQKLMPRSDGYAAQVTDWNANYHATMVADAVAAGANVISNDTLATLAGVTYLDAVHPDAASGNAMGDAIATAAATWAALV